MKKAITLLLILLLVSCQLTTVEVAPVLMNSGFEEGWWLETTYWTLEGGPFHDQYQEITPGEEWTAWWQEGDLCVGTHDSRQGRPEVRVISRTPDPTRVHSADQALLFFTFWRCHRGGLYQQVTVEPGKHYTVQAFVHTWFANCDTKPHYRLPLDYSCDTDNPILWAQLPLRICIDTVCSDWEQRYGSYSAPLRLEHVQAVSSTATIILESIATHPLKHCNVYWDDVSISESYQVFLPLVAKES